MELFIDKDALQTITTNLEKEITIYKANIDNYYRELDSMNMYWTGTRYDLFMELISKNRDAIKDSCMTLKQYHKLIQNCLNSYTNLQEGIHYNES